MAVLQAILAFLTRSAGKLLNTAFGWATRMLFGKVPDDRQTYLSVINFASVIWLVFLVGVVFPEAGVFLLSFIPLPDWVDERWVSLAMLAVALLLPLGVGFLSLRIVDPAERPTSTLGKLKAILKGYPYTFGLALTLILMTILAPILKVRDILRRWSTQHFPVIIEPSNYRRVLDDVAAALEQRGMPTDRRDPSWMLDIPTRILGFFSAGVIGNLIADELKVLRGRDFEVILHPTDMVVSGPENTTARVRTTIAEQLAFSPAYMTWTKEANELEDRLEAIWHDLKAADGAAQAQDALSRLAEVDETLRHADLAFEEWEVLFRGRLLVERAVRELTEPAEPVPHTAPAAAPPAESHAVPEPHVPRTKPRPSRVSATDALTTLVALVLMWLRGRRGPSGRQSRS